MNLKAAARSLGVHYQTAYKWVRTGQLTAVRIGARYDVSEAAIAQFHAGRRSLLVSADAVAAGRRSSDLSQHDVLQELAAMAADPIVTVASVANFAARRGAAVLGDACLVVLMDPDGQGVARAAIDHPEPDRAAFLMGILEKTDDWPTTKVGGMASAAYVNGAPVLIPHVPQERLRKAMRPEFRQFIPRFPILSLVSAPVRAAGAATGFVGFTRDTANHPYTPADVAFASEFGLRIGWLLEAARQIEMAWLIRSELADAVGAVIAGRDTRAPISPAEFEQVLSDHPMSAALPVTILDPDLGIIAANAAFLEAIRCQTLAIAEHGFEALVHPGDRGSELLEFGRLISGECDYLDVTARRVLGDGTDSPFVCHRVAVREPDGTLACIITVARPLHLPAVSSDRDRVVPELHDLAAG